MTLAPLLTDREVAALLAVRPDTVRRWAARGDLPHVRLGRLLRFKPAEIDLWITSNAGEPRSTVSVRRRRGAIASRN